jgi:hypothetical protein
MDYQYNPKGSKQSYKKKIPITHNLRILKIKAKEYKGSDYSIVLKGITNSTLQLGYGIVYNFMLEEVLDYGPSNIGKFAR